MPGYFTEDPGAAFRRNVWINPFWEDDVEEVVDLMGDDRVIFGSDWPHIERHAAAARLRHRAEGLRRRVAAADPARQHPRAQYPASHLKFSASAPTTCTWSSSSPA